MPNKHDIQLRVEKYPAVVYIDSINATHVSAAPDLNWLLERNEMLETLERTWKRDLSPSELISHFTQILGENNSPTEQYVQVFLEEEEAWHFIKGDMDESLYPNGYASYYVLVIDDLIVTDDLNPKNVGRSFQETFKDTVWQ